MKRSQRNKLYHHANQLSIIWEETRNDFLNTIAHNIYKRRGHQPNLNHLVLLHAYRGKIKKSFINKSYCTPTETDNRLHVISWSCYVCNIPLPELYAQSRVWEFSLDNSNLAILLLNFSV